MTVGGWQWIPKQISNEFNPLFLDGKYVDNHQNYFGSSTLKRGKCNFTQEDRLTLFGKPFPGDCFSILSQFIRLYLLNREQVVREGEGCGTSEGG